MGEVHQELHNKQQLQIINVIPTNHKLSAYLVIICQDVFKALHYIRGILHLNPFLEGRNSDLVILEARTEKCVCKFMGKFKSPEDLSIGRRWFANSIPGMLSLQPYSPKSPYHQDLTTPIDIQKPYLSKTPSSKIRVAICEMVESLRYWQSSRSESSILSTSSTTFSITGRT